MGAVAGAHRRGEVGSGGGSNSGGIDGELSVPVQTNGKGEVGVRCGRLARGTMREESGTMMATGAL
jgi:hypothetical protein